MPFWKIWKKKDKQKDFIKPVSALIRAGELDKAIEVAEMIADDYKRSIAFSQIASACAQTGELDKAVEIADSIRDYYGRALAFVEIASALIQDRELNKAIEILDKAMESANLLGEYDYYRSEAFAKVASVLAQAGEFEKAIEIADSIKNDYPRSLAYTEIGSAFAQLVKAGELNKALDKVELVSLIEDDELRSSVVLKIVPALFQAGKLDKVVEVAEMIEDDYECLSVFTEVASTLIKSGKLNKAIEILDKAIVVADLIEDGDEFAKAVDKIASTLIQVGKLNNAIETELNKEIEAAKKLEDDELKLDLLSEIVKKIQRLIELKEKAQKLGIKVENEYHREVNIDELSQKLGNQIKKTVPRLTISLNPTEFSPGGRKARLIIRNSGSTHAEVTEILLFNKDTEDSVVMRILSSPDRIDPGEEKTAELWLKFIYDGEFPLNFIVKYRDAIGRKFKKTEEIWVKVESSF